MAKKLTEDEIKKKLIEGYNYKKMYENQKKRNIKLNEKNKKLEVENKELKEEKKEMSENEEKYKLRIEELQKIAFKKSKTKLKTSSEKKRNMKNRNRTNQSYRKRIPSTEEITKTNSYKIENCNECWSKLTRETKVIRYEEDMVLPVLENTVNNKEVEKQVISKGYCNKCKRVRVAKEHSSQRVMLWENVKIFIAYCITILRLSMHQTKDVLKDIANIEISDWEISNILREHAKRLRWQYDKIKDNLKNQKWVHFDETGWKVRDKEWWKDWDYCWIMKWTETSDTIYTLWKNRWKWNAEKLLEWNNKNQVWISDNYWAYKHIFKYHQLCWAHPNRKIRDLVESDKLDMIKHEICVITYEAFRKLYKKLKNTLAESFDIEKRTKQRIEYMREFDEITEINWNEPEKLRKIKESLARDKDKYFTCMIHKWIPADNNAAERGLRHIVLKRKNSFWSKTSTWADVMSVLFSVMLTLWNKDKDKRNFFKEYANLVKQLE